MIGIVTRLEAAEAAPDDAAAQRYIDDAKRMTRENLREVRHFIWELRPPALEGRRFEEGVRQVAESWAHMHGISAAVVITGAPHVLSPAHELALLRVTQEALANVGKHEQAHVVTITLSYVPNAVLLDINDDGRGFALPLNAVGYGLVNMRERIEALGGTLTIESAPHDGTTLVVELPLNGKG
ncbi:MAG: sensor histidine kinase, partial [Anaerolineae bacterium]|nr:sensor histidine kinase [Anaerolineae bacterium]